MPEPNCNNTCCLYENDKPFCFDTKNFTDYNEIKDFPAWELILRWTSVTPMMLLGVLGNLTVIAILLKNRLLMRNNVNIFIFNMSVSDLFLAIAGPIPFTIRCTHQFWVLGELWCHLDGFIQVTVMQVSVTSLSIISIDRLLGILSPSYTHLKKWQAFVYIAGIWIVSCVLGVPFYIYRNFGIHQWADVREVYCEEYLVKTRFYWLVIIIALNWIPLMVMTTCYLHLFLFFKKHSFQRNIKGVDILIKNRKKLLKMLFVMILAFCICWLPLQFFIIYREKIIFSDDGQVSTIKAYDAMLELTQYIVYLYPVINPFIYSLMHQNFKNGFRITFPCFFKEEANFILRRGNGSRPYVWSRTTIRHTIHATSYEANRKARRGKISPNSPIRRTFSFDAAACDPTSCQQELERRHQSVTFGSRSTDISGSLDISRHSSVAYENSVKSFKELSTLELTSSQQNTSLNSLSVQHLTQRKLSFVYPTSSNLSAAEPNEEILTREEVFNALRSQGSPAIPQIMEVTKSPKNERSNKKKLHFQYSPKLPKSEKKRRISRFQPFDSGEAENTNLQIINKDKVFEDKNKSCNVEVDTLKIPVDDTSYQTSKKMNSPKLTRIQNSIKHLGIKIGENLNSCKGPCEDDEECIADTSFV